MALSQHAPSLLKHPPLQVCYSVPDLAAAASHWSRALGAGPFFLASDGPLPLGDVVCPEGAGEWSHTSCLGSWGRLIVELMQHHSAAPASLAAGIGVGQHGLHHMAITDPDPLAESERLEALGSPLIIASEAGGVAFRIHDASAALGCRLEVIETTDGLHAFNAALHRAATGWDGSDPLRPVTALSI